ncbi:MAG: long-chain acyl-CoA synthetase [Verrucomicrobiales bacterium]|jgi:long-chain acyl-CoA synthetase
MSPGLARHLHDVFDLLSGPGSPLETTQIEVRGQTYAGYEHAPSQVRQLWLSIKADDSAEYLVYEDESITYGEARARVLQVANALIYDFGVQPGDSVGLALRNYPEWILGWWAIQMAGAAAVQMNSFWNGEELTYGVTDSGSSVMIVDQARHDSLVPHRDTIAAFGLDFSMIVVRSDGELDEAATPWDAVTGPETVPDLSFDDEARSVIVYTSGTTAFPKGVVHSQRNVVTSHLNAVAMGVGMRLAEVAAKGGDVAREANAVASDAQSVMLVAVPLFHVTGSHVVMLPITATGGKLVLMYKWSAETALELIEREKVSSFTGVPTMTMDLLASPEWSTRDTSSLKSMGSGGAPNPPHMVGKVNDMAENATARQGYGLSETGGIATAISGVFYEEKPGSCGIPPRVGEVKVVDDLGNTRGNGERGELCLRGPHIFVEYHNLPDATAEAIDPDGWFHTGDIATVDDDGFVSIIDRAKDVIIRGGENVAPAEVEAAIARHPAVRECAVFGVAHERLGEEVAVAVHPFAGEALDPDELREFAGRSLAKFKVPAQVFVYVDPLPKNANGKVLKRQLREESTS